MRFYCISMLAALLLAAPYIGRTQENLVSNGDFQNGTSNWLFSCDVLGGANVVATGNGYARISASTLSPIPVGLSQTVVTIPGAYYEISFSYYWNGGPSGLPPNGVITSLGFGDSFSPLNYTNWSYVPEAFSIIGLPQNFDAVVKATKTNSLLHIDFVAMATQWQQIGNISVKAVLSATQQPQSQTILISNGAAFSILVDSPNPVSYQWYFSNTNLQSPAGANALMAYGFVYGVEVTNGGSGYTAVPNVQFIGGGGTGAAGTAVVSNGTVIAINMANAVLGYTNSPSVQIDPPKGLLLGQTNATLTLNSTTTNEIGNYFVVVSNSYGSITSSIALLNFAQPPSIREQPQNDDAPTDGIAMFNVVPDGTPPFGFQWWMVSAGQSNATAVPIVLNGFVLAGTITGLGNGYLSVPQIQIVGGGGSGASGYAVVSNRMVTAITITNAGFGYTSTPAIAIDAPSALDLLGQTNDQLNLMMVSNSSAANYFVVITNNYGSVTSTLAALTIFLPPQNFSVSSSTNHQLSLQLRGTAGHLYSLQQATNLAPPIQWQPVITNTADGNGNWKVTVTNSAPLPMEFFRAIGL